LRKIRMVVFDLDGTLTPVDSLWRYLHQAFGTWDKGVVAAQRYRRGEISYEEWAETDAGYWVGLPLAELSKVLNRIPYRVGASKVFEALKERGVRTVILSAGLSILADKAAKELGADLALSNELQTRNGSLTGEIKVKVAVNEKHRLIEQVAAQFGIKLTEVALVGDRANDLPVTECLRIAFKPKDQVARQEADFVIEDDDLSAILPFLGIYND
jgi:phosphoserine phosphatase